MSDTWTDTELDAALADLARVLDDAPGAPGALAAVRDRLPLTPAADPLLAPGLEVLELGPAGPGRRRPRAVLSALVVAAVVLAAVLAAVLVRPGAGGHSAPPAGPGPSALSAPDLATARQRLLPVPVRPGTTTLLVLAGVGDASVSIPPVSTAGPPVTLGYGFVCGDPRFRGNPNDTGNDASRFRLTDNLGSVDDGWCAPLADGLPVGGFSVGTPVDPAGRANIRVHVASPDTVWKLSVTSQPR